MVSVKGVYLGNSTEIHSSTEQTDPSNMDIGFMLVQGQGEPIHRRWKLDLCCHLISFQELQEIDILFISNVTNQSSGNYFLPKQKSKERDIGDWLRQLGQWFTLGEEVNTAASVLNQIGSTRHEMETSIELKLCCES
ncbi:hypothetical protein JTB14_037804 [Gonioctena quinquepunctata]|nr:hypothetical protein JTB14_037804 [Gonioctena quinquepunctata]